MGVDVATGVVPGAVTVIVWEQLVGSLTPPFASVSVAVAVKVPAFWYVCPTCKLTLPDPIPPPDVISWTLVSPKLNVILDIVVVLLFPAAVKLTASGALPEDVSAVKLVQTGLVLLDVPPLPPVVVEVVGVGLDCAWVGVGVSVTSGLGVGVGPTIERVSGDGVWSTFSLGASADANDNACVLPAKETTVEPSVVGANALNETVPIGVGVPPVLISLVTSVPIETEIDRLQISPVHWSYVGPSSVTGK